MTSCRGQLLVAAPGLADPNFCRVVVLVLDHGADGAIGVVLNRPSAADAADALPAWRQVVTAPRVLFVGGPVAGDRAIGLGVAAEAAPEATPEVGPGATGFAPLGGGIGTVDLSRDPADVAVDDLRVFLGYSGWSSGQLEAELVEGSWIVADAARSDDVFGPDPDGLWARVLRRQPGRVAWLADCPADVSTN